MGYTTVCVYASMTMSSCDPIVNSKDIRSIVIHLAPLYRLKLKCDIADLLTELPFHEFDMTVTQHGKRYPSRGK